VPESGTPGSVRGVTSNGHSYRDHAFLPGTTRPATRPARGAPPQPRAAAARQGPIAAHRGGRRTLTPSNATLRHPSNVGASAGH